MRTLQERFDHHVYMEPMSGCWIWTGTANEKGYGAINIKGKQIRAHRCSWILHHGEIPDGLWVLHHCDNPPCVNPDHLFLGTRIDNMVDSAQKGRNGMQRYPELSFFAKNRPTPRGEQHSHAKLRESDVRVIRERLKGGERPQVIAYDYGLCRRTIELIKDGTTWTHLK